jgi:hypothetical protein
VSASVESLLLPVLLLEVSVLWIRNEAVSSERRASDELASRDDEAFAIAIDDLRVHQTMAQSDRS